MGVRVLRTYLQGSLLSTGARGAVLADILFAPESQGVVSGQHSGAMAGMQSVAAGALAVAAASALAFGAMTSEAAGTVGSSAIAGQSATVMDGMQQSAAGSVLHAGQSAASMPMSGAAAGSVATSGASASDFGASGLSAGSVAAAGSSATSFDLGGAGGASVALGGASAASFAPLSGEFAGSTQGVAVGSSSTAFSGLSGAAAGGVATQGAGAGLFADLAGTCAGNCVAGGQAQQPLAGGSDSAGSVALSGEADAVLELSCDSAGAVGIEGDAGAAFADMQGTARGVVGAIELPPPPADLTAQSYRKADARKRVLVSGMVARRYLSASRSRYSVAAMTGRDYITRGEDEMLSTKDPDEVVPVTFSFKKFGQTDALESATVSATDSLGDPIPGALPSLPVVQGLNATQLVAGGVDMSTIHLECIGKYKSGAEIIIRAALNIAREAEQPGVAVPNLP